MFIFNFFPYFFVMPLLEMISRTEELELDEISDRKMVDLIASLIEGGEIWQLDDSFQRVAIRLMDEGYIDTNGKVLGYP